MAKKHENPSIFEANMFYLIIGFLLINLGYIVQKKELYTGLIITEYIIVLLPTILYLMARNYDIKKVLRLNKLTLRQIVTIPLISIFSYPVGAFLNYIVMIVLSRFTEIVPTSVPIPENLKELFISFLIISLSAGICEETMFRGFILSSYNKLGIKKAIIMSSVMFGLFHFNIQNLVGPIFLGIIFGLLVYKTNSIFSSIIAHITNNTVALLIGYFTIKGSIPTEPSPEMLESMFRGDIIIVTTIFLGIISIVMGCIALMLFKSLPKSKDRDNEIIINRMYEYKFEKTKFYEYIPVFIVTGVYIFFTVNYILS